MKQRTEAERRARMDKIGLWLAIGFTAAGVRPSKRLYTYEEMCDEIPARARQEDFTMIVINGRKMWQKRAMA